MIPEEIRRIIERQFRYTTLYGQGFSHFKFYDECKEPSDQDTSDEKIIREPFKAYCIELFQDSDGVYRRR